MPFLIINFGGEMIYILEQRLHAQNIPKDKSNKGIFYNSIPSFVFFSPLKRMLAKTVVPNNDPTVGS